MRSMVGLRIDREGLQGMHHPGSERTPGAEIEIQQGSGEDTKKNGFIMDPRKCLESKLTEAVDATTQEEEDSISGDADRARADLRAPERSEEEDVIDVSPSGCTLSSLTHANQDTASRVKNMFVFDNTFTVLPPSIRNFKNLRKLKFFSNEVRTLPQELGDLTHLEHLYLKICPTGLGSLPPLGNLRSLRALELHQVPARPSASSLSREIAQLHSLTRLSVCHFSISWVPAEIGSLKNLEELDLSFNKLKVLPKELVGLKALKTLRVASNKLVELPSELTNLPSLTCIDVAHNRLTSLSSLELVSMTSLRALNVQFNKLQNTGDIPKWINIKLEGNDRLNASENECKILKVPERDDYLIDWEISSSEEHLDDSPEGCTNPSSPVSLAGKGNSPTSKGQTILRGRRGWKKQDNQQQKARQDRLNSSRKHRSEDYGDLSEVISSNVNSDTVQAFEIIRKDGYSEEIHHENASSEAGQKMEAQQLFSVPEVNRGNGVKSVAGVHQIGDAIQSSKEVCFNEEVHQDGESAKKTEESFKNCQEEHASSITIARLRREPNGRRGNEKNFCRKAIIGDRSKEEEQELSLVEFQEDVTKEVLSEDLSTVATVAGVKVGRRQDGDIDRNPKPCKRRRSVQEFSRVSYKYCMESFCGFDDRLHDGFYDAGRDRPFLPLEVLEREQPCFDSREVILVDREKDEELDVMALSAQQLLAGLDGEREINVYQRIAMLALFVSDCFGGSDKTQNISNMRRAAVGGTAGMPFVCSCSSSGSGNSTGKLSEKLNSGAVLPSVHMLCEGAVRFLKSHRGSNILPIGSLTYGVCRHRAILFKYLCDRAEPPIPCELVRGYLDYMPHAWNVTLVENSSGSTRMLVDACRPLDIRPERDPEYFCRYIPLRRVHLPLGASETSLGSDDNIMPILHEDIGHGASGAIVRLCTFGNFKAAAKVRQIEPVAEGPCSTGKGLESSCLSELRMLCSLQPHPCIVTFYGHQFSSGFTSSSDPAEATPQPPQLMIFMEYVKGGSLEGILQGLARKGQTHTPHKLALHVARNIACALSLLHSKGIIHRDIKSSNVLIDLESNHEPDFPGPVVKLCDFDSAVPLQSSSAHTCYLAHRGVPPADVCVGTPRWIAPEVLRAMYGRHTYGLEADLWSFGCLLAELLTLQVPYAGLSEAEVHSHIQMGQRPLLPSQIDKFRLSPSSSSGGKDSAADDSDEAKVLNVLVRLFYSCTDPSPTTRPTAKEALSILTSAMVESIRSVSSVDEQIQEETSDTALEALKRLAPKVDEESSQLKDICSLCSLANNCCSCSRGGKVSREKSADSSDPDSCNE